MKQIPKDTSLFLDCTICTSKYIPLPKWCIEVNSVVVIWDLILVVGLWSLRCASHLSLVLGFLLCKASVLDLMRAKTHSNLKIILSDLVNVNFWWLNWIYLVIQLQKRLPTCFPFRFGSQWFLANVKLICDLVLLNCYYKIWNTLVF